MLTDSVFSKSSYKLKVSACEKGSAKERKLMNIGVNYLYVIRFCLVYAARMYMGVDLTDC